MEKKKIMLLIIFLSISLSAISQKKVVKLVEKKKLEKALEYFKKNDSLFGNDVIFNLTKSKFFLASRRSSYYNIDSSFFYVKKTKRLYDDLDDKAKEKLVKKDITKGKIKSQFKKVNRKAYERALNLATIESYDHFLLNYTKADEEGRAIVFEELSKLSFEKAKKENTLNAYKDFQHKFWGTEQAKIAKKEYDKLYFEEQTKDNKLTSFENYIKNNPKNPNVRRAYVKYFNLFTADGELSSFELFEKKFPEHMAKKEFKKEINKAYMAWSLGLTSSVNDKAKGILKRKFNKKTEFDKRLQAANAQKNAIIQFSLIWDNYNDLDLVCELPTGEIISLDRPKSNKRFGVMNMMANKKYRMEGSTDKPIENIYFLSGEQQNGKYKVYVRFTQNFDKNQYQNNCPYSLRIISNFNEEKIINKSINFTPGKEKELVYVLNYQMPEKFQTEVTNQNEEIFKNFIIKSEGNNMAYLALEKIVQRYLKENKYSKAISTYKNFFKIFTANRAIYNKIEQNIILLENIQKTATSEKKINLNCNKSLPVITAAGNYLYFNKKNKIYYSSKIKGKFISAKELKLPETVISKNTITGISVSGNMILLENEGDIYYIEKEINGWSKQKKFPSPVNTEFWEGDAVFSPDGRAIIFASDRTRDKQTPNYYFGMENYKKSDLYISVKDGSNWTEPINLGNNINTFFSERTPYLDYDMKTLYFSSDGYGTFAGQDVFMVKRESEDWTKWSKPKNLGKNVNSVYHDLGYKTSFNGNQAYILVKDIKNESKIKQITGNIQYRKDNVFGIDGKVYTSGKKNLNSYVIWENRAKPKTDWGIVKVDPQNNTYFLTLLKNKSYNIYCFSDKDYFFASKKLDLRENQKTDLLKVDLKLIKLETNKTKQKPAILQCVEFKKGTSKITPQSYSYLDRISDFLKKNKNRKINILGHTDNIGSKAVNKKISQERAQAVIDYIKKQGISSKRLKAIGMGESSPIYPNTKEKYRKKNRRVELIFCD